MNKEISMILESMVRIDDYDQTTMAQILNRGDVIIVADEFREERRKLLFFKQINVTYGIKYVMFCVCNKLHIYTLKDATDTNPVMTLACVMPMDHESFDDILYDSYLKNQDAFFYCKQELPLALKRRVCILNSYTDVTNDVLKFIETQFAEDPKCICYFEAEASGWNKMHAIS